MYNYMYINIWQLTEWITGKSFIFNLSWFYDFDFKERNIFNSGTQRVAFKRFSKVHIENKTKAYSLNDRGIKWSWHLQKFYSIVILLL